MSNANGVVNSAEQEQPESLNEEKGAAAAGEQRPSEVSSPESAGAPESYQGQFFSVLHDIVSSEHVDRKKPTLLGKRTDLVARLLTLSRRLDDGWNPALYQQAYFAALLWKANPSVGSTVSAVIDDIEFSSSRNSPIYTVMYGLIASAAVSLVWSPGCTRPCIFGLCLVEWQHVASRDQWSLRCVTDLTHRRRLDVWDARRRRECPLATV